MHLVVARSLQCTMARLATLATLASLTSVTACASLHRGAAGIQISSAGSDYSPQLRADVHTTVATDSVHVRLTNGSLVAPGDLGGNGRALMRGVTLEALVVAAPPPPPAGSLAPPPPWEALTQSARTVIADSLLLGVAHPFDEFTIAIPRPPSLDLARSWLVFRIRATGVATPVRLEDGTVLAGKDVADGVRVFACSERNLDGRVDRKRAKELRRSYIAAC